LALALFLDVERLVRNCKLARRQEISRVYSAPASIPETGAIAVIRGAAKTLAPFLGAPGMKTASISASTSHNSTSDLVLAPTVSDSRARSEEHGLSLIQAPPICVTSCGNQGEFERFAPEMWVGWLSRHTVQRAGEAGQCHRKYCELPLAGADVLPASRSLAAWRFRTLSSPGSGEARRLPYVPKTWSEASPRFRRKVALEGSVLIPA
jgi:hypothetical protein